MSDDLISRRRIKSLIEMIRDCWAISPYVSANDMKLYSKVFNVVLNEISNCPTAFDKEKVMEKLEELSRNHFESADAIGNEEEYGESFAYKHAVEVVRKGGMVN